MQLLHDKRAHVVAWRETEVPDKRALFLSVAYARPDGPVAPDAPVAADVEAAKMQAIQGVNQAAAIGLETLERTHRQYWHNFYTRSFFSIPDTRLESFYWIQLYKMASATRQNRPILDLMGPWFRTTPWPAIWWNLNIQLTYWPVYAANHLELGASLIDTLDAHLDNLIGNVPEAERVDSASVGRVTSYELRGGMGKELGNLPWTMHNYWLHLRHSMDETRMRDKLFPLLRRATNVYLHRLQVGDDGRLHLPVAISPEYPQEAPDTNYDLALLRWSCITLLGICERFGIEDPLQPKWRDTLAQLTPAPTDETGLMIGRGVPLAESHRHFSHLFSIYPLHLLTPDAPQDRALIERSLDHWLGLKSRLQGYSYTGGSSIASLLGRRDDAVKLLNVFLDKYLQPNTMYTESGPVIETPLAGAASLQEIVLQSWESRPFDSTIRVFPAVPDSWRDVSFDNFSAEGGFVVSAQKRDGQTAGVRIQSLAGEPCKVSAPLKNPAQLGGTRQFQIQAQADGVLIIDLKRGEEIVLGEAGTKPDLRVTPVQAQTERTNSFGSRKTATTPAYKRF